jgi:hypothetical protein
VTGETRKHRAARARRVADLPTDALLARAEEIARRWAIALIVERPLAQIGELPLEDLAREAPALCALAIRALGSDVELERLTGGEAASARQDSPPAMRVVAIAGAHDARDAVEAVEALRGVIWETLLDEHRGPSLEGSSARELAEISDRLAYVCASLLRASLPPALPAAPEAPSAARRVVIASAETATKQPATATSAPADSAPTQRAVIIDEHDADGLDGPAPGGARPASRSQPPYGRAFPSEEWPAPGRPVPSRAEPSRASKQSPDPPPRAFATEIEIRDERGEEGPAAWIRSIGRQLERFEQDGLPFAVLLVEVVQVERMLRERSAAESSILVEDLEQAIAQLRPRSGSLTRERVGRYWLLAPRTDRLEAARLAERMIDAVGASRSSGVSLELAIGTALCPEHGREAAALAAQADIELYSSRTSMGRTSAPLD